MSRTLKSINIRRSKYVAKFLRSMAKKFCDDPSSVLIEDAQDLDRALRCCDGISDIDKVWVRWSFQGEPLGWLTNREIVFTNWCYEYPNDPDTSSDIALQEERLKQREN